MVRRDVILASAARTSLQLQFGAKEIPQGLRRLRRVRSVEQLHRPSSSVLVLPVGAIVHSTTSRLLPSTHRGDGPLNTDAAAAATSRTTIAPCGSRLSLVRRTRETVAAGYFIAALSRSSMATSSADRDLLELDLYHLLDPSNTLTSSSPQADISRYYRKQARLLHPDKNLNNPRAAEQFDTLQRAYELLTDETKRGEYDEKKRKREEKKRKADEEDVRVRTMRERLEEREKAGKTVWDTNKRQTQTARIQRENEAVIQQLRQRTQPAQFNTAQREPRREERKQAEADEGSYGKRGNGSVEVEGRGVGAGVDIKAYETSTLERMRELAKKRKEEKQKQQATDGSGARTTADSSSHTGRSSGHPTQRESEVIVLDDASGAMT